MTDKGDIAWSHIVVERVLTHFTFNKMTTI